MSASWELRTQQGSAAYPTYHSYALKYQARRHARAILRDLQRNGKTVQHAQMYRYDPQVQWPNCPWTEGPDMLVPKAEA